MTFLAIPIEESSLLAVKITISKLQGDFIQVSDLSIKTVEKSIDFQSHISCLRYSFAALSLCVLFFFWKQVTDYCVHD
jgi:hypothetical protein